MARPNTPLMPASPAAAGGFCRRLPEVSAHERDFWRRAVEEERARLDLAEHGAAGAGRHDVH